MEETTEIIKLLLEANKELTQQILALSREVAAVKVPVYDVPMETSLVPLHTPETEEDAVFALKTGQIDKKEYENILRELDFYNAEITTPISE